MRHLALPVVVLLVVLAGCGDSQPQRSFNERADARYTVDEVAELAGFESDMSVKELKEQGIEYDIRSWSLGGCGIDSILTRRAHIQTYVDYGEPVVTNTAGDVGVVFSADPGCREKLVQALAKVP